ncbi:hypothetical protein Tco_1269507 [Tanacetum coccineum]
MISSNNNLDLECTDGPSSFDTSSSEDIMYSSPDIVSSKGPPKHLLKWYDDLTNKDIPEYMFSKSGGKKTTTSGSSASKAKPFLSLVSKDKSFGSSSSKADAGVVDSQEVLQLPRQCT